MHCFVCLWDSIYFTDFDAIEDLQGGLGALKLPPPQPTSHEYGAYLRQQKEQREARKQDFTHHASLVL